MSEVKGRSREDPMPKGRRPRGVTPRPRSGAVTRGVTPHPRSGAAAERSNPTSKEWQLRGRRRAEKSYSTFKVRRGDLVQGRSSGCSLLEQP